MCLIFASQYGEVPATSLIRTANSDNPDGWGVCRVVKGHMVVEKGWTTPSLINAVERCKGLPYMAHMRWATHGTVNRQNTHPFKIASGLFMAHNGILKIDTSSNEEMSDTAHYAQMVKEILADVPEWWNMVSFIKDLEDDIGFGNKLTFLKDTGELRIINRWAGEDEGGIWYSNTNSHPVTSTRYVTYGSGYRRIDNIEPYGNSHYANEAWWERQFQDRGEDLDTDLTPDEYEALALAGDIDAENDEEYQKWIKGISQRSLASTDTGISSLSEHKQPVDIALPYIDDDWWANECRLQAKAIKEFKPIRSQGGLVVVEK